MNHGNEKKRLLAFFLSAVVLLAPVPWADGALTGSENGAWLVGWEARYHPIHTPIHRRTCLAPMADVYIHVLVLPTLFGLGN